MGFSPFPCPAFAIVHLLGKTHDIMACLFFFLLFRQLTCPHPPFPLSFPLFFPLLLPPKVRLSPLYLGVFFSVLWVEGKVGDSETVKPIFSWLSFFLCNWDRSQICEWNERYLLCMFTHHPHLPSMRYNTSPVYSIIHHFSASRFDNTVHHCFNF